MSRPQSYPVFRAYDDNNLPLVGGKVYTYAVGTSTAKATYSDRNLSTANANPVVLDSNGEATIYISGPTKIVLKDSADVTLWTQDWVGDDTQSVFDAARYGTSGTLAAINAAITAIGSDVRTLYIPPGTWSITSDLTIPSNITLKFETGAVFSIATTKTLTVNGTFEANRHQILSYTGTGTAVLNNFPEVYPEWWGATGDGTTEDTAAFNNAFSALANGGTIRLSKRTYVVDTLNDFPVAGVSMLGSDKYNCVLKSASGNTIIHIDDTVQHSFELGNFKLLGNGGAGHGLLINGVLTPFGYSVHDLYIKDMGGKGIYDTTGFSDEYRNIYIDNCGDNAIEGNFNLLQNIYVGAVTVGDYCGYRIYNSPTMISCNGINSGNVWGVFGRDVANDGTLAYSFPTLINCNIEDFGTVGILCRAGSSFFVQGYSSIIAPAAGTVKRVDVTDTPAKLTTWDGLSITSKADPPTNWTDGLPIHCKGGPPAICFDTNLGSYLIEYYDDDATLTYKMPLIGKSSAGYLMQAVHHSAHTAGDYASGVCTQTDTTGVWSQIGAKDQSTQILQATSEVTSFTAGATHTIAGLIPAGSLVIGVTTRVTQLITGLAGFTSFDIGDGSTADKFGNNVLPALDTVSTLASGTATAPAIYPSGANIVLTAVGANFEGGAGKGKLRVTVHYITLSGPSS